MNTHQILIILAVLLALIAGVFEWAGRAQNPPSHTVAHAFGWFALASLAASMAV